MAYSINLTNGSLLTTVQDGTVNDTSCSLTLIGRNYSGYGTYLNDNFVHLLENGSNSTEPSNALVGQLWWDTAGNLKVHIGGQVFKTISSISSNSSSPTGSVTGNFWWDTTNEQLNVYNGTSWILVGPTYTAGSGTSGVLVGNIVDNSGNTRIATNVWVNSNLIAIISSAQEYTPQVGITGYTTIKPGINLISTSTVANTALWGTASNAAALNGISGSSYVRNDQPALFSSTVQANVGFVVGTSSNLSVNLNTVNAQITNNVNSGNLLLRVNVSGVTTDSILVNGSNNQVIVSGNLTTLSNVNTVGNVNSPYVNINRNIVLNGKEDLANGAAVNLAVTSSYFSTSAAETATLAAGTEGQVKTFMMISKVGNMVITVTNPGWGGSGLMTFSATGQGCTLQYVNSKWYCIGNNGVTFS